MNKGTLEEEKLRDWFHEKYNWKIYKGVERDLFLRYSKEHSKLKRLWYLFWGIPEEDRIWLIEETKKRLNELWKKRRK